LVGEATHRILQKVIDGEIELFISHEQFEELARVLDYPKFDFTEEQKARFMALISAIATFVEPKRRLNIVKADPSDNRILEYAQVADVDFIVSGDEHLLHLGNLGRTKMIVTVYRFEVGPRFDSSLRTARNNSSAKSMTSQERTSER
jgi:putative PIN family toxin of toxin-antitoxin system